MSNFYITGDTHGVFKKVVDFCSTNKTTKDDVMIILGDAGINYKLDESDRKLKAHLQNLPITLFCIHGNHEERPFNIKTYKKVLWNGGIVYAEDEFPNILFAKDGEIYNFNNRSVVAIGGAYSMDKYRRLAQQLNWFEDEQPSDEIKSYVEQQLDSVGWKINDVLSHTCPLHYQPPCMNNSSFRDPDEHTERWLNKIDDKLSYDRWFAGHYHEDLKIGPIYFLLNNIQKF